MHYKQPKNRDELFLNPHMDQWVAEDSVVRLIDVLVDGFIKEHEFIWAGTSIKGCTSYPPGAMLKLLLYCYFNWIPGSRRMEKETHRNIEVMWLLGCLNPDHWTICKFRRENKELIHKAAISFRKFLIDNGFMGGNSVVFDGSKMKAYASRDMLSEKVIANRISNIEQQLDKYLDNSEELDNIDGQLEKEVNENQALKKKIEKLENEKSKLETAKKLMEHHGTKYISPSDPDARLMKSRDGKMACYNIQSGVDPKHNLIALAEATNEECDINLLGKDFENFKNQLGIIPKVVIADKGYANIAQIKDITRSRETDCYIPIPEQSRAKIDKENGIHFKYNDHDNTFECTNNKKLHLHSKNQKGNNIVYNIYKCKDCDGCPIRQKCTKSKTGRAIKVNVDHQWIAEYKRFIEKEHISDKMKKRKAIVEHPFGTIKMIMGKFCFVLRKLPKVQVEVDIYTTIYNIKRLTSITDVKYLIEMAKDYNWKAA